MRSLNFLDRAAGGIASWVVWLLLMSLPPSPVHASQNALPDRPRSRANASRFEISDSVRAQLRLLWSGSITAKQERVACLGGYIKNGVSYLTKVEHLATNFADSLGVSATVSIRHCSPPVWFGTVHTHVALHDGVHPYASFSGADRGVMLLWWRQWKMLGVFCVLYTEQDAHCEADGLVVAGPATHATY